jgi:uncharacterized protein YjiK
MISFKTVLLLAPVWLFLFPGEEDRGASYDYAKPDQVILLPPVLHEVSGLTEVDSTSFVCVQDEIGVLFFYDLARNEISRELPFALNGDYEGITRVGKTIYVLRSDGSLFEIPDLGSGTASTQHYMNDIPSRNNEGLCYDRKGGRLLVGSKGRTEDQSGMTRTIYAFDLLTKKLVPKPVYKFDVNAVTEFAVSRNLMEPYRVTVKGKKVKQYVKFYTSEIAIHPVSGDLYVLSAADHMLFIFERKGVLKRIEKLDPGLFNQPEGITFFENGDMLVTNEGKQKYPTLLRFNVKR